MGSLSALLVVVFILSPYVDWYPGARYADLFVFPLALYLALGKKFYTESFYILLIGGIFAGISSIFYATFNGLKTSISDYIFPIYWLRYALIYAVFNSLDYRRERITHLFIVSQLILVLIAILQWNNIFGVAELINNINTVLDKSTYGFEIRGSWRRAYVFSTNANYFSFLLVSCFVPILLHDRKIVVNFMTFVTGVGLFVAGSRSGMLAFSLIIVLVNFVQLIRVIIMFIPILLYSLFTVNVIDYRLFSVESFSTSIAARFRDLINPLISIISNPSSILFGFGPLKEYLRTDSHNGWTWMLMRTGIFGLSIYIAFLRKLAKNSLSIFILKYNHFRVIYLLIPIMIGEFTQNIFKDTYTFEVFILALVLIAKVPIDNTTNYLYFKHNKRNLIVNNRHA